MDHHPVPFPTSTEMSPEKPRDGSSSHYRVNSSPTLPNLWLPQFGQSQSRARPHLRPLDLAASPKLSHKSSAASLSHSLFINANSSSPRRAGPLLTPPLTPSSSFASSATTASSTGDRDRDVIPSTPPEGGSPLRWGALRNSRSQNLARHRPGYFTPPVVKDEIDLGALGAGITSSGLGAPTLAELSARFGKMEVEDVTPRMEKTFDLGLERDEMGDKRPVADVLDDVLEAEDGETTRFLLVLNIPKTISSNVLRTVFGMQEIKGILVRFQESHGAVFLAYYDVRDAIRARRALYGKTFAELCGDLANIETDGKPMDVRGVSPKGMEKVIGQSSFVAQMDGSFVVSVENRVVQPEDMQQLLASFGEVMAFCSIPSNGQTQAFRVEYYDVRQRDTAFVHLNDRTMFGARLRLSSDPPRLDAPFSAEVDLASPPRSPARMSIPFPDTPSPVRRRDVDIAAEFRVRPRSVSASESMGFPDAVKRLRRGREGGSPPESGSRSPRSPSRLFFDPIEKIPTTAPVSPDRQRSVSMGPEQERFEGYAPVPGYYHPDHLGYGYPYGPAYDYAGYAHPHAQAPWGYGQDYDYYAPPPPHSRHGYLGQGHGEQGPSAGRHPLHTRQNRRVHAYDDPMSPAGYGDGLDGGAPASGGAEPSSKNQLDLAAIENGVDTRTTVMIKNIPNKMTDRDLLTFINRVCARRIDFLYLRMDFQNGCNVGYAFVNFITVQDLFHFAQTQLGVKWNMYSSEKVLQMSYANYQGKEALVEKFKNSCIMDEREAWRPKIFYSDGPNQGLPEPFPPPTHLRRKERSASNRGALFVPGAHHYGQYHGNGHQDAPQNWRHAVPPAAVERERAHAPRFKSRPPLDTAVASAGGERERAHVPRFKTRPLLDACPPTKDDCDGYF